MKTEIKISDSLLSWVFGCECEFVDNLKSYHTLIFNTDGDINNHYASVCPRGYQISTHTFIHLAKIKAFECGFTVTERANIVESRNINRYLYRDFYINDGYYDTERIIQSLEWVNNQIQER